MDRFLRPSLFFFLVTLFHASAFAQTGPGGVGNSSDNALWLDASTLILNDGDALNSWTDLSGNSNHATQASSARQPKYKTGIINSKPVIRFDGSNDLFNLSTHITSQALTFFSVFSSNTSGAKVIFESENHLVLGRNIDAYVEYNSRKSIRKTWTTPSIFSLTSDNIANSTYFMTCDNNSSTKSRTSFYSTTNSTIGGYGNLSGGAFNGDIPELIVYNTALNSAQRNIITNYLSTKYNLTAIQDLYSYDASYGNQLIGIGQEADGSNLSARGMDSILISNPSTLNDGDYLFVGNDNAGFGTNTNVEFGLSERWDQTWRAGVTGTPGNVDIEFFLGANGFAAATNYVLLIENGDGDFTNGGTTIHETGRTFSALPSPSIKFTNVNLSNGAYFTLAEKDSGIESVKSGEWEDTDTWSCNCIPTDVDVVTIISPHLVEVNSNAEVLNLTLNSGASMTFDGFDTLKIYGNFVINGTFNAANGVVSVLGSSSTNEFYNNSASRVDFNNLYVNSTNGLTLANGGWAISNNLQVKAGGMDVSAADSIVLLSTATKTSQILASMSNAFTGNFIVQRYISSRTSNFSDISTPISNGTFNDLDDDLPISGANGADGNATASGGGIFYSLYKYNSKKDKHDTITNINSTMIPNMGYEVYLMSTLSTFNAKTIDFIGIPNSGDQQMSSPNVFNQGWNLLGNPFHSFIDWSFVTTYSSIPNLGPIYYIYNTNNGSYDLLNASVPIAPEQAFWVYQPNTGGYYPTFSESAKVNSNSATFYRQKYKNPHFKLKINSLDNSFANELNFNFNAIATSDMDIMDIPNLPSPIQEAPSITAKARNSTEGLILNSLNPLDEHQLIPISVKAGITGSYEINAENLDALFNNYSCAFLKDKATNQSIDLIVEPSYHFEAEKGESDRFELILSNNYDQCHNLLEDNSFIQKLDSKLELRSASNQWFLDYTLSQENTQLSISVYNLAGQEVIAPIEFSANGAGSYAIREIQNLEGIYLIRVISKDGIINKTVKL
ncbi:MAG: T9SS type A sorting domain-containing protein [Bacteroidetes bacterium]|nr:T9SS type A sorting domain-containing protein [Bacteroidota bacterium]